MKSRWPGYARIGLATVLALVVTGIVTSQDGRRMPTLPLEISNADDCPIRILERRTRVAGTLDRDPWGRVRSPETRTPEDRTYGPGEFQIAFDVAFENRSVQDVAAVVFLWEARTDAEEPIYERVGIYETKTIEPGQIRLYHEVELDPARGAGRYRVSVRQVEFADGSTWVAPTPAADGRADGAEH